jgi:hypothetical protein
MISEQMFYCERDPLLPIQMKRHFETQVSISQCKKKTRFSCISCSVCHCIAVPFQKDCKMITTIGNHCREYGKFIDIIESNMDFMDFYVSILFFLVELYIKIPKWSIIAIMVHMP